MAHVSGVVSDEEHVSEDTCDEERVSEDRMMQIV